MSLDFLICSERSGSNLITKILNNHSKICGPSPKHVWNPVIRNLFRYEPISNPNNWNELLIDIHRLLNVKFSSWNSDFDLEKLKALAEIGDINNLLLNIYTHEARAHGKDNLFIKENHTYEFLPYLLVNFPESKFVFQTRDPRDMALSWKKSKVHIGGIVNAARQWQKDQQKTLKNSFYLKQLGTIIFTKYEDILNNPRETISNILSFLDYSYEENILNFYKDNTASSNSKLMDAWENISKPLMKDNLNKYKKELTELEVKYIEKICFYEMRVLGYKTEYGIEELNRVKSAELEAYDKTERSQIKTVRPIGVTDNIRAKTVFYRKLIK